MSSVGISATSSLCTRRFFAGITGCRHHRPQQSTSLRLVRRRDYHYALASFSSSSTSSSSNAPSATRGWWSQPASLSMTAVSVRRSMSSGNGDGSNNKVDDDDGDDIGQFVSGLTQEQVDSDPVIRAYVEANYTPSSSSSTDNNNSSSLPNHGINVPDEVLKEFGLTDAQLDEMTNSMMSSAAKAKAKKAARRKNMMVDDVTGRPIDGGLAPTIEQQQLNIRVLKSYTRTLEGTRRSEVLREDYNLIPGVVCGGDPTQQIFSHDITTRCLIQTPWSELQRELDRYHRHFESRVYDLTVYDLPPDVLPSTDNDDQLGEFTTHRVVPRNVQRHPVMGKIYCTNFVRYHAGRPLKLPLKYVNVEESPALKRDGYIVPVNRYVECFVEDGVPIPEYLEVECTGLVLKDVIRMDRVIFPDGVRYTDRTDVINFVVGPVQGGRGATMGDADNDTSGGDSSSSNDGEAAA